MPKLIVYISLTLINKFLKDPPKNSNFVEDFYRRLYTEPDNCHSTQPFFAALKVTDIDQTLKDFCDR